MKQNVILSKFSIIYIYTIILIKYVTLNFLLSFVGSCPVIQPILKVISTRGITQQQHIEIIIFNHYNNIIYYKLLYKEM